MTTRKLLFSVLFFSLAAISNAAEDVDDEIHNSVDDEEEEIEPAYAILFPPFYLTIGAIVFYILSRYIKALPYTAVMFLLGVLSGIAASLTEFDRHLSRTLQLNAAINSEVLLLVFLPGLIFKDAMGQSVHLFCKFS